MGSEKGRAVRQHHSWGSALDSGRQASQMGAFNYSMNPVLCILKESFTFFICIFFLIFMRGTHSLRSRPPKRLYVDNHREAGPRQGTPKFHTPFLAAKLARPGGQRQIPAAPPLEAQAVNPEEL